MGTKGKTPGRYAQVQGEGGADGNMASRPPVLVSVGEDTVVRALWGGQGHERVSTRGTRMGSVQSSPELSAMCTR